MNREASLLLNSLEGIAKQAASVLAKDLHLLQGSRASAGPLTQGTRRTRRQHSAGQPTHDLRRPYRDLLAEDYTRKSLKDPQNVWGAHWVKNKYQLPHHHAKNQRCTGSAAYSRPSAKRHKALPTLRKSRPLTEEDAREGVYSLLTKGLIPRDVDLSLAFERGEAPLQLKPVELHN